MKEERKTGRFAFAALILFAAAVSLFLFNSSVVGERTLYALRTFLKVVPSVFPYLVFSGLFFRSGLYMHIGKRSGRIFSRVFRLPQAGLPAFVAGLFCGFPVGAKCAIELFRLGKCTKEEAGRIAASCDFCGPPFLIYSVGRGIFGRPAIGWTVFLFQTLFALIFAFFYRRPSKAGFEKDAQPEVGFVQRKSSPAALFTEAVGDAAVQTLKIGGFIVFFSILSGLCFLPFEGISDRFPQLKSLFYGFFEMSSGIAAVQGKGLLALLCASAVVCFSGVSVFMQSAAFLKEEDVPLSGYLLSHLLCPLFVLPLLALSAGVFGFFS